MQAGYTDDVSNIILSSRRNSTQKQYNPHIIAWEAFCKDRNTDAVNTTIPEVLQFLHSIFSRDLSYSTINTARSAISTCILLPNGQNLGQHRDVQAFMTGVYNNRTPVQQKSESWDPDIVLHALLKEKMIDCVLNKLVSRLALLILLVTGQRPQVLSSLN